MVGGGVVEPRGTQTGGVFFPNPAPRPTSTKIDNNVQHKPLTPPSCAWRRFVDTVLTCQPRWRIVAPSTPYPICGTNQKICFHSRPLSWPAVGKENTLRGR
ncbi:unnamed protein product [Ectocarpus sp. 12 AP-2014]